MKLEDEAKQFRRNRQEQFYSSVIDDLTKTEDLLLKHLHDTKEREHAITKIVEAAMWVKRSLETHGLR